MIEVAVNCLTGVICDTGGSPPAPRGRSGGFDKGRRPVRLSGGSGWLLACPHEPDEGRREGSLVKSTAALVTAWSSAAPELCPSRQPTGVWRRRCGSASESCGVRAVLAARAAPRGAALKPYRKFSQTAGTAAVDLGTRGRPAGGYAPLGWMSSTRRTSAKAWNPVPEPTVASLPPRGQAWEMTRYRAYEAHLAGRTIGEIFGRPAAFLELTAAEATSVIDISAHAAR